MNKRFVLALLASLSLPTLVGCAAETAGDLPDSAESEDALASKPDEHWFYNGAMPALEQPKITVSLKGHTARLSGLLPQGTTLPVLPHVKTTLENGRTRVDAVYPIATAKPGKTNSRPGTYKFHFAKPYRPDGSAFTQSEGEHFVPWGGFPFLAYDGGIAFHGPITFTDNLATDDLDVWVLKRGTVSGGCNRMLGEHVVELTHAIGIDMRKVYQANVGFTPTTKATVTVIPDYDTFAGKAIDVDYPTDVGVVRPGKVLGSDKVVMFGSWVASELPNGKDLPPNMKWEGGVANDFYVFAEHVLPNTVCSAPKGDLARLRAYVARKGQVPTNFCAKKSCYLDALRSSREPSCK
jgi:hypothetical protein